MNNIKYVYAKRYVKKAQTGYNLDMSNTKTLVLSRLENEKEIPGVGEKLGKTMAQACAVCLSGNNHSEKVIIKLQYNVEELEQEISFLLNEWETVTDNTKRQWGDSDVAAEFGAYGLAILFIVELTEFTAIERSRKGTGFDYWLGKKEYFEDYPFQREARLEVSGLFKQPTKRINERFKQKVKQPSVSDNLGLPAYIVVVEFSKPIARMGKR